MLRDSFFSMEVGSILKKLFLIDAFFYAQYLHFVGIT